jgi:hypothetical protein
MNLRGLVPNFYIHVSVRDFNDPYFSVLRLRTYRKKYINRSQIHECRNWKRDRAVSFLEIFFSNFRYSAFAMRFRIHRYEAASHKNS